ncbi:hypothetical protein ACHAQA_001324 [Verticillium albo-atrum]
MTDPSPLTGQAQDRYSSIDPFPEATALGPVLQRQIVQTIQDFYRVSDDPESNEAWLNFFTEDATAILGGTGVQGTDAIRKFRTGMWAGVKARSHWVNSAYVGKVEEAKVQIMLDGAVRRISLDNETALLTWAGRAVWEKQAGGAWKMSFYRVWLNEKSAFDWVPEE